MIGFLVLIVLFSAILQFPSEVIENVGGKIPSLLGRLGHSAKLSSEEEMRTGRFLKKIASYRGKPTGNANGNKYLSKMRSVNPLSTFMPCESTNGEDSGICLISPVCSYYGGKATDGFCKMGLTCCVNEVNSCGPLITFNNTYWQSPAIISSESSCGLTIKLDQHLIEQKKPICQIRLDFLTFSLAQPNAETICSVDSFQVAGAVNKIPAICGDNNGQHIYLMLPRISSSVQIVMTFGTSNIHRMWNIKIALLPCDADYLAPDDCLQYFTSPVGSIMTFNWKDKSSRITRQLAGQDYYICFRTELVNNNAIAQVATALCLSHCEVSSGLPFSLSGNVPGTSQAAGDESCTNDYIVFPGGFSLPPTIPIKQRDRFCGTTLSQVGSGNISQTICSTAKPFRLLYRTNGDESITPVVDANPLLGNQGFCLKYEQKFNLEIDRPLENED
ncbi:uncharacterized protein LOC124316262 isoform X4 [Daphnia pulicaria]|uniref:uncharacterized protein LOC124316262 isoform X4 n=1 Tax=Daphnia pulicaria TaxID=35523 RepID=UPI001EEA63C9|nr:uncharacterized protein LOC124316262 isoform X4 [Daphnia pulicaria]